VDFDRFRPDSNLLAVLSDELGGLCAGGGDRDHREGVWAVGDDERCAGRDDEVPRGGEDKSEMSVEAAAEVRRDREGVLSCEVAKFLERFIRWGSGDLLRGHLGTLLCILRRLLL
jgi:hypothetical protein